MSLILPIKRSILLQGCFFFMLNMWGQFSQHQKYTLDTILYMKDLKVGRRVNDYASYNVNDSQYSCLYKHKKKLCLETYHFKTRKRTSKVIADKEVNTLSLGYHFSFASANDTCVFISDTTLVGYILSKNMVFMKRKIKSIEYSGFSDHVIYYGRFYNHIPDKIAPACIYRYNIQTGQLDSVILKHDFMEYTHYLPAKFIAFGKNELIYPDFGSYKVYIQNNDFTSLDSVTRDIPDWISPSRDLNLSIAKNPNDIFMYFPLLDKECFEHMDRIEHLEFIDTNSFLVRWYRYDTTLQQRKRIIDIWIKKEGKYTVAKSYYETIFPLPMDHFMLTNGIPLRSDEHYTHYTKDYIIQLKSDAALDTRTCKTYREYLEKRETYGKTDDPVVSFWVFKKL